MLTHALSRETRALVKVALAGDGGDEILGGYPRYQGVWLAELVRNVPPAVLAAASELSMLDRVAPERRAPEGFPPISPPSLLGSQVDSPTDTMYFRWVSYLDAARKNALIADRSRVLASDPPAEEYEFFAAIRRRHSSRTMRDAAPLVDLQSFLPHNVLNYGDRMSMAHGLEVRVPFCDHRHVEALAPLPLAVKIPAGVQKGLFRWAVRGDLREAGGHAQEGRLQPAHRRVARQGPRAGGRGVPLGASRARARPAHVEDGGGPPQSFPGGGAQRRLSDLVARGARGLAALAHRPKAPGGELARRRLIVTGLRGPGGAYSHLASVLPRIIALRPDWDVELYATPDVVAGAFGGEVHCWMRPVEGAGYSARVGWDFARLPALLLADPKALVYSPFGAPLNVAVCSRVVWMSRNIIPLLPMDTWEVGAQDRLRLLAVRLLLPPLVRNARRTICVSHHGQRALAALAGVAPERIAVIPHGIEMLGDAPRGVSPVVERLRGRPFILHAGQPVPYRRTKELVRAYKDLARRRGDFPPLVLAGKARAVDADYERECLAVLEPLIAEGRAVVTGQLSHADTRALMRSASVFVYPSVHEDCPNVVLEALQAGRTCVLADIPANRELAGDAAVFVRDPWPLKLAEAIERVAFDEKLRSELSAAATARARTFTWDLTAQRTVHVLEEAFLGG